MTRTIDPRSMNDPLSADRYFRPVSQPALLPDGPSVAPHSLAGEPRFAGVCELLDAYADGSVTPEDVLESLSAVIKAERVGSEAVLRMVPEAIAAAGESSRRWRQGNPRPLEGIPFGIKDIIDVAGTMTTCGSRLTGDRVAAVDADVVAKLRAAGAIPFAMLATSEFATGSPINPRFGPVTNPWDIHRWAGGSSSGSAAALAGRLLPLTIGSDSGGSIRVPACWCGVTGFKPGREVISRAGAAPLSWTLDHIGPMARSSIDIATVMPFMAAAPTENLVAGCRSAVEGRPVDDLRIGIPANWFNDLADSRVLENWRLAIDVFRSMGCGIVDLPSLDIARSHEAGWTILFSEFAALHDEYRDLHPDYEPALARQLQDGGRFSAVDYGRSLRLRAAAQEMFIGAFEGIDVMLTPGLGAEAADMESLAVEIDGAPVDCYEMISRNTMIFNFTGFPALALPSGFGRSGLPTGMQIAARPGDDALCLRAGAAFQNATDYHRHLPAWLSDRDNR